MFVTRKKLRRLQEQAATAAAASADRADGRISWLESEVARLRDLLLGQATNAAGDNEPLAAAMRDVADLAADVTGWDNNASHVAYCQHLYVAEVLGRFLAALPREKVEFVPVGGKEALVAAFSQLIDAAVYDIGVRGHPAPNAGAYRSEVAAVVDQHCK
ncbi:hypothetical protein HY970_02220 [Candidatus Kaiserbacteria bacterium]|nr:hypothetical protein [Candidatus Kaiserbacteria bacterium]